MTIWNDICDEMTALPGHVYTTEAVLEVLEMGVALAPITCILDATTTRLYFIKLAAAAVRGIELIDAEIEAEADDDYSL